MFSALVVVHKVDAYLYLDPKSRTGGVAVGSSLHRVGEIKK